MFWYLLLSLVVDSLATYSQADKASNVEMAVFKRYNDSTCEGPVRGYIFKELDQCMPTTRNDRDAYQSILNRYSSSFHTPTTMPSTVHVKQTYNADTKMLETLYYTNSECTFRWGFGPAGNIHMNTSMNGSCAAERPWSNLWRLTSHTSRSLNTGIIYIETYNDSDCFGTPTRAGRYLGSDVCHCRGDHCEKSSMHQVRGLGLSTMHEKIYDRPGCAGSINDTASYVYRARALCTNNTNPEYLESATEPQYYKMWVWHPTEVPSWASTGGSVMPSSSMPLLCSAIFAVTTRFWAFS